MVISTLLAHTFDLLSFSIAVSIYPFLANYERMPTALTYTVGGIPLSLAMKAAGLAFILVMAHYAPRYRKLILGVAFVAGLIGCAANFYSFFEVWSVLNY